MNPKNIDRLFQEKLKNLEATPNKRVWNNIESNLKNKKRSVLPMWWFSGGIAALFLLGLFLFPIDENQNINNNNDVIITDSSTKEKTINNNNIILDTVSNKNIKEEKIFIVTEEIQQKKTLKKQPIIKNKTVFIADNNLISEQKSSEKVIKDTVEKDSSKKEKLQDSNTEKSILKENIKPKKDFYTDVTEEKKIEKKKLKKTTKSWSVSPVFAILNSNSFSDTSPIDTNLSNSTIGKNSFSFGVQIAYKINDRWSVQSGIHQQKTSFQNNNITITSANSVTSAVFSTRNSFSFISNVKVSNLTDLSLNSSTNANGNLIQEYGYIEIPIEVKYNLSNNQKFNTQLVAGFSSLFLNTNSINLTTANFNESGSANNLNAVNFSGNFGIDFSYYLNNKWSVNLNPMFKAQLNTFSKRDNGFSPFNIGVYSGIKYNF